jgi:phage-related minor tail protein
MNTQERGPDAEPEGEKVWTEELKVQGDALLGKIKELAHEGNVRRIIIKDAEGKTLIEIPLTVGVVGAIVAPVAAGIGAIAALAADYSIVVEHRESNTAGS